MKYLNVVDNVNVCEGLETRCEKMFRKCAQGNTFENGLKHINLGKEEVTISYIPYSTFWGILALVGVGMVLVNGHTPLY